MIKLYRQYNLISGNEHLTAWLQEGLKKGWKVNLADSDNPVQWWKITSVGDTLLPKDEIKGSHNSKAWYKNDLPRGRIKGLK